MSAHLLESQNIQQLKEVHHGAELAVQVNHLILFRALNPDDLKNGQTWVIGETFAGGETDIKRLEGHLLPDDFKLQAFAREPWRVVRVERYESAGSLYDSIQVVWCERDRSSR